MPTPLYDDPTFFDGYARLRENPLSTNDVLDMPAIKSLLPPLDGLRVLDWAAERAACAGTWRKTAQRFPRRGCF